MTHLNDKKHEKNDRKQRKYITSLVPTTVAGFKTHRKMTGRKYTEM